MVTAEEIGAVTIFAGLELDERERLARVAADITLDTGEYAAHPGAERALFGLLDGRIEAVQLVDGIERIVGSQEPRRRLRRGPDHARHRLPGRLPGDRAHAGLPDRGPRLSPRRRGRARRRSRGRPPRGPPHQRRGGPLRASRPHRRRPAPSSSAIASTRAAPSYAGSSTGTRSCTGGSRPTSRTPSSNGAARLPEENELPSVRVLDDETVVKPHLRQVAGMLGLDADAVLRPQLRRIAELLDLGTEARRSEYDVVVVGAGPAGLAAAVYGASEGLDLLVDRARGARAVRPAPRRGSRTTSASRTASRATSSRAAR